MSLMTKITYTMKFNALNVHKKKKCDQYVLWICIDRIYFSKIVKHESQMDFYIGGKTEIYVTL